MSAIDDPLPRLEAAMQRIAFAVHDRGQSSGAGESLNREEAQSLAAHFDLLIARIDDLLERFDPEKEER